MSRRSNIKTKTNGAPSLAKGLFAGLIGGVAATAAKAIAEKLYPVLVADEPDPLFAPAKGLSSHELTFPAKSAGSNHHWGAGALAGAAYGAVAELYPPATARNGAAFGLTLATLKQDGTLPALRLSAEPVPQTPREQVRDITLHVVYGVVTESVRRAVRRIID